MSVFPEFEVNVGVVFSEMCNRVQAPDNVEQIFLARFLKFRDLIFVLLPFREMCLTPEA